MLVHIEIGRVGATSSNSTVQVESDIVSSRSLSAAGKTDFGALPDGPLFVTLASDTAAFFSIGPAGTVSAAANPRRYLAPGIPRSFSISNGQEIAVAAS